MAEAAPAPPPGLEEALSWFGYEVDDISGQAVGRVDGVYADAESGAPAWLVVTLGRRRLRRKPAKAIAVPVRECAALPRRAWAAEPATTLRAAPTIDPGRPLLREHEVAICTHYGIGEQVGRHAEVEGRPEGSVTSQPVVG